MTVAFEAFGVTDASAGDFDFYGLRRARIYDSVLLLECGYLRQGMPPTGTVLITLPSRDTTGAGGLLYVAVDVLHWKLSIDSGGHSTVFVYTGVIDSPAENTIDFQYRRDPDSRALVVNL